MDSPDSREVKGAISIIRTLHRGYSFITEDGEILNSELFLAGNEAEVLPDTDVSKEMVLGKGFN